MKSEKLFLKVWSFLRLGIITTLFFPTSSYAQTCFTPPSGIVGWWQGEGTGNDIAFGNNGTFQGSLSFTGGEVGTAFYSPGNSSGLTFPATTNLQLQNFTVEAWIAVGNPTFTSNSITDYGLIYSGGDSSMGFGLNQGGSLFLTKVGNSFIQSPQTISDGAFHHVAVTKNGSIAVFYVDGVPSTNITYNTTFSYGSLMAIAARADTLDSSFLGTIDEVSIYNRALSSSEISGIYTAGSAGKCLSPTVIVAQPSNQAVPAGNNTSFSVSAMGFGLNYQWQYLGNAIYGATNSILTLTGVQNGNAGSYNVIVSGLNGTVISSNASLTIINPTCNPTPSGLIAWWKGEGNASDSLGTNNGTLNGQITYGTAEVGQGFNLSGNSSYVSFANSTNLRLQSFTIETWIQIGNTSQLTGGTTTYGEVFGYGSQGYSLAIDKAGNPFLTTVGTSGVFSSLTIADGNFHHVAVTKNGTNVIFYVDGIAGPMQSYITTFAFNTLPAIGGRSDTPSSGSFAGVIDEVSVYNRALFPGEIQAIYNAASSGKCTGPTAAAIESQPANQSTVSGGSATFNVGAGGSSPLSYQWLFNNTTISGATNSTLTISNVQTINVGAYLVIVTNAYGSATSTVANLTVQGPPVIIGQSGSQTVVRGGAALFYVDVSGTAPLTYHWQLNGTNLSTPNDYTLSITNAQITNAGIYTVVVSNTYGAVTSSPAVLTVLAPPIITNQPQNQTNFIGGNAVFSVGATSPTTPLSYQWRFNGTNIVGANKATFTVTNLQAGSTGNYSVVVTNIYGSVTSSNAQLTTISPSCDPMPSGLVAWWQGEGSTRDTISGLFGTNIGTLTYSPGKVGKAFTFTSSPADITVANSTNLQLQSFTIEAWIQVSRTNQLTGGTLTYGQIFGYGSQGYALILNNSGQLSLTRVDVSNVTGTQTILDGAFHHVAVTKNGTNVVFYIDGVPSTNQVYTDTFQFTTAPAIGNRADSLSTTFLGSIDEVSVYNRALSSAEIQSLYASTTIGKCAVPLALLNQPTNQTVINGASLLLSPAVSGTGPLTYQWYQNGAAIFGATNASLSLTKAGYFQTGNYSVIINNSLGTVVISNIVVTVQPPPLLVNGSFETGDFTGWITNDIYLPLYPLAIRTNGFNPQFGFFTTLATDGSNSATHGFEGYGPGKITIAQDVFVPSGPATLTFDYRAAWDMLDYSGSTQPKIFSVSIQPFGGGIPLHSFTVLTEPPQTANSDTGPLSASLNLTPYSGRSLRVSFEANVPEYYTGPGFFELDHVALAYSFLPPLAIANLSNNIVLSWPASTTNYTLQSNTNLTGASAWTAVNSNLISHGLTNTSITLPATSKQMYYRLKYP